MRHVVRCFSREEEGQDVLEYTMLLAFVVMASAALFIDTGASVSTIWNETGKSLSAAKQAVS
jgi:Flp pilus assembly pilin Flp